MSGPQIEPIDDRLDELRARLRTAVREKGISMREASLQAGCAANTISRIIKGGRRPSPSNCIKLARYFGWPADEILALAGHRQEQPPPRRVSTVDQVASILRRSDWPHDLRESLIQLIRNMDPHRSVQTHAQRPSSPDVVGS